MQASVHVRVRVQNPWHNLVKAQYFRRREKGQTWKHNEMRTTPIFRLLIGVITNIIDVSFLCTKQNQTCMANTPVHDSRAVGLVAKRQLGQRAASVVPKEVEVSARLFPGWPALVVEYNVFARVVRKFGRQRKYVTPRETRCCPFLFFNGYTLQGLTAIGAF